VGLFTDLQKERGDISSSSELTHIVSYMNKRQ